MSLIADLRLWNDSVTATEEGSYDRAVELLERIVQKSAKTHYNAACCLRAHTRAEAALQYFSAALEKDEHMAIAYFQRGNTYFQLNRLSEARRDYEKCIEKFRGRKVIDYNQLGLKYKFYICEPLHNAGCVGRSLDVLLQAQSAQAEPRHSHIQDSIRALQTGQTPTIITIPNDLVFRPPKSKMSNLSKKDYLGRATVVSEVQGANTAANSQLAVTDIPQKSTSAPNSPLTKHKHLSQPVLRKAEEGRSNPALVPKSVSVNQNLALASLIPPAQQISQSKSDSSIHQLNAPGRPQPPNERPQQYPKPWQNQQREGEKPTSYQPRRPSLPQGGDNALRRLPPGFNEAEGARKTTSGIPPPPSRPAPPRPPPKLTSSSSKPSSHTVQSTASSLTIQAAQTKPGKGGPDSKQEDCSASRNRPQPPLPPKPPMKPPKPRNVASEEPMSELKAMRAALKPVGQRNKPDL